MALTSLETYLVSLSQKLQHLVKSHKFEAITNFDEHVADTESLERSMVSSYSAYRRLTA